MAKKYFCDVTGCGKEVEEGHKLESKFYYQAGFKNQFTFVKLDSCCSGCYQKLQKKFDEIMNIVGKENVL